MGRQAVIPCTAESKIAGLLKGAVIPTSIIDPPESPPQVTVCLLLKCLGDTVAVDSAAKCDAKAKVVFPPKPNTDRFTAKLFEKPPGITTVAPFAKIPPLAVILPKVLSERFCCLINPDILNGFLQGNEIHK